LISGSEILKVGIGKNGKIYGQQTTIINMKSVHQPEVKQKILDRLNKLNPESQRHWGKMSVGQMLAHVSAQLKLGTGEIKGKAILPAWIQYVAKQTFGFRIPWTKSLPTAKEMTIKDERQFEEEKQAFLATFQLFMEKDADSTWWPHPIFGKMSKEEWGKVAYKHLDHHFRQFGV